MRRVCFGHGHAISFQVHRQLQRELLLEAARGTQPKPRRKPQTKPQLNKILLKFFLKAPGGTPNGRAPRWKCLTPRSSRIRGSLRSRSLRNRDYQGNDGKRAIKSNEKLQQHFHVWVFYDWFLGGRLHDDRGPVQSCPERHREKHSTQGTTVSTPLMMRSRSFCRESWALWVRGLGSSGVGIERGGRGLGLGSFHDESGEIPSHLRSPDNAPRNEVAVLALEMRRDLQ